MSGEPTQQARVSSVMYNETCRDLAEARALIKELQERYPEFEKWRKSFLDPIPDEVA